MDGAAKPSERRSVDPVWTTIKEAAQAAATTGRVLAGMLHAPIPSQPRFESALSYHLARLAGTTEVPAALIRQIFDEALTADPAIGMAARLDIVAVADRDPACTSHLDPLLWFKGYHALQTSRVAHWLWLQGRQTLAHFLQSRAPHPRVRRGLLLGAGAKVLGNIEIGACAKIAAGSVVLEPVPAGCTAAGVPARIIGCVDVPEPAMEMDQRI